MSQFPFTNETPVIQKLINTSAFDFETLKREMDELKCINIRLEDDLRDSRSQCIALQESTQESALQINMLKSENLCLHSKLNAEQQTFQTRDSTLKEKEAELRDTKLDVIQLKTESTGLKEKIVFLEYMRDKIIDLEKFLSSITKGEFNGQLWEQLELQILEMIDIIETMDM